MQSTIERISPVECRVRVEVPWPEVSARLANKMRDLGRRARIPGFRPGKVPPKVLERMYGKSVRQELANDLVEETFQTAVSQHDTLPLTQPVLESSSLETDEPFKYEARFEVPPNIEPKDYKSVPVRRRPAVADEEKVEARISELKEKLTELRPIEEGDTREETQAGDVWTLDVEGALGDQRVSRKDVRVDIGEDGAEFIPGLAAEVAKFKLADVGGVKRLQFTPPAERLRPELRGKEAQLDIGIREVRVKHVPEVDDEFARDTGEAESLDELMTKIRDEIRAADAEQAEQEAQRRLIETLLERNPFDPAPSMVAREVSGQVDQTKQQLAQQGLQLSAIGTNERELAQRIRPQALFNVRAYLLIDAIGKTESLKVGDEEFEEELKKVAEERGENVTRMRATMEKNGQLYLMRAQMDEKKVLDFLMDNAEVTEAPDPAPQDEDGTGSDESTAKGTDGDASDSTADNAEG